jgi:transcriptional regulator with XRE-family HTH domain
VANHIGNKEKVYTQKELAERMGLIQALISAYENEKIRLNEEMIIRFAKSLDVSANEIFGLHHEKRTRNTTSLKSIRRVNKIESLPDSKQKALLKTIDAFLETSKK